MVLHRAQIAPEPFRSKHQSSSFGVPGATTATQPTKEPSQQSCLSPYPLPAQLQHLKSGKPSPPTDRLVSLETVGPECIISFVKLCIRS